MPTLLLPALLSLPLASVLVPLPAQLRRLAHYSACGVPVVQLLILLSLWPEVRDGTTFHCSWPWLPELGLHLSLVLDGLSWLFASLIAGVGVLVFVYAAFYLRDDPHLVRLYRLLLLFNSAMMGVVLAGNLILLAVCWELTSVASFLLIGFRSQRAAACEGATKSLLLTAGGGLIMLLGILLVFAQCHTLELFALLSSKPHLSSFVGLCFLIGAFTKSAQFPFHIWLPAAMEAPTPVSAYLHAATMVKAGLYLVARLSPLFAADPLWSTAVTGVGGLTLLWGGALACKQTDLKALLAYSTVSQLGLIMLLLGVGTQTALLAALLHIVNHAAFKGALFLTAGAVEHATGTRDLRALGGLRAAMPLAALAATLAALSMAGLPPLGGFVSKELFYEALLGSATAVLVLAVASSCLTFFYSFLFFHGVFFGRSDAGLHAHDTPIGMLVPILVLSGLALLFGLTPGLPERLISPALAVVSPQLPQAHLALWHGWTPALGASVLTIVIGGLAFLWRGSFVKRLCAWRVSYSLDRAYSGCIAGLNRLALSLRTLHMTGSLTDYVRYVMAVLVVSTSIPLWRFFAAHPLHIDIAPAEHYETGLALLMAVSGVACCLFRSRVPLILSLGLVGALVSIFFVLFSAPDLALAQILVESVGLVLFLLVFRFLSPIKRGHTTWGTQALNLGTSLGSGLVVAWLLLAANSGQIHASQVAPFISVQQLCAGRRAKRGQCHRRRFSGL